MTMTPLSIVAALGSGLIAGIFFAFSVFIMKSFSTLAPSTAIAAMQAINKTIVRTLFIPVFFGTAAVCVYLLIAGFAIMPSLRAMSLVLGSGFYLLGCMLVTVVCNVPRNNKLARLPAGHDATTAYWQDYVRSWTRWNHVRTAASLLAALLFTISAASA